MSLPYSNGNFANWAPHEAPELSPLFEGDTTGYTVAQKFRGKIANYSPANINGNTHWAYANAYCVRDSEVRHIGGGIGEVTRFYATIPAPRLEPEFYPFTYPAISSVSVGAAKTVIASTAINTNANLAIQITSHGWSNANLVSVNMTASVRYANGGNGYQTQMLTRGWWGPMAILASNANYITVRNPYGLWTTGNVNVTVSQAKEQYGGRAIKTLVAPAYSAIDYFFPGITAGVTTTTDIPIMQASPFIETTSNTETANINANSSPTVTEWFAAVAANEYFIAEPSQLRRWQGNIFERVTKWVKYM
jgi:hypothetical protein